ncbi:MAG TPA: glycosyltransferase family A protein [Rhodopila sp.]|nr:glycosyltransferase family A protein [Rhodopila sp.]
MVDLPASDAATLLPSRDLSISAIVPVFNGARHIAEAIQSIFAQTLLADEVIVIDDGSTDNSAEVLAELAQEFPIRIISQENGGQSAARNTGVEHARGDLLAFLDQDDVWHPDHLAELVKPFHDPTRYNLGWTYSDLDEIDESGQMVCRGVLKAHPHQVHPKCDLVTCLRHDMFILPSATLVARTAFQQVGGFNERLSGYEDDDLFLRLFRAGFDSEFISKSLSKWRIYSGSSSYSPRMAASRLIYARLLIERFPDVPERSRFYVRDLIAPRFFRSMSSDFRRCVLTGNCAQQKVTLAHVAFISRHLRLRWRLPLQFLIVPALRIPVVARLVATWGPATMRLHRRVR